MNMHKETQKEGSDEFKELLEFRMQKPFRVILNLGGEVSPSVPWSQLG
jgi:hypothetical protein